MYLDPVIQASAEKVAAARAENVKLDPRRMTAEEKDQLLRTYHPDYREDQFQILQAGPNRGDKVPHELADLLQARSRVIPGDIDLTRADYDVDVLVIGGGGAGTSAAIEAHEAGASVMVVTKLRMGDANTMMAEGGIQAADKPNDSPAQHFLDAYGGGHFAAQKDLLSKLVTEAPEAIAWLSGLGVEVDKAPDGTMITTHGGGTSRKRMHAAKDYSGAEIMRTLRDEALNREIPVVDFTAAMELVLDENGRCAGAVLMNMETRQLKLARARTPGEITAASGYARRKIVQLQSALRSDPDNKERIQAAIRQLQKAVRRAGKKQRDIQGEKLAESRRKKALEEKNRRKAAQLRQELTRTRALRSIRESGYIREAEMDNRTQEHLSAARLELRTQLQELTAATAGVSAAAAAHQYAAAQAVTAAEVPEAPEAGAGLDMLA